MARSRRKEGAQQAKQAAEAGGDSSQQVRVRDSDMVGVGIGVWSNPNPDPNPNPNPNPTPNAAQQQQGGEVALSDKKGRKKTDKEIYLETCEKHPTTPGCPTCEELPSMAYCGLDKSAWQVRARVGLG